MKATAWILFNNLSGLACVDSETRLVGAIGAARSRMLGLKASNALKRPWLRLGVVQDRRPITPPPCIRLVVKDASTNKELDIKLVAFHSAILSFDQKMLDGHARPKLKFHLGQ